MKAMLIVLALLIASVSTADAGGCRRTSAVAVSYAAPVAVAAVAVCPAPAVQVQVQPQARMIQREVVREVAPPVVQQREIIREVASPVQREVVREVQQVQEVQLLAAPAYATFLAAPAYASFGAGFGYGGVGVGFSHFGAGFHHRGFVGAEFRGGVAAPRREVTRTRTVTRRR